ncbi:hypothetical protein D3C81_1215640 [compost metagenome]
MRAKLFRVRNSNTDNRSGLLRLHMIQQQPEAVHCPEPGVKNNSQRAFVTASVRGQYRIAGIPLARARQSAGLKLPGWAHFAAGLHPVTVRQSVYPFAALADKHCKLSDCRVIKHLP